MTKVKLFKDASQGYINLYDRYVTHLIDTFENGKEIGSLLIVEEKDYDKVTKYFEDATPNIFNRLLWEGLKDIIRVAKILSKK